MAIAINRKKCDSCGECVKRCAFEAILMEEGFPAINAGCKMCGICIRDCEKDALILIDDKRNAVDKEAFSGILVFGEIAGGKLHPVVRELIGKALMLAEETKDKTYAVVIGDSIQQPALELLS